MIKINWQPDRDIDVSLSKQIVDYIKGKIISGKWAIGTVLPSQRKLAEIFEVGRSTVVQATEELKHCGYIDGHGRGGTRVIRNELENDSSFRLNWHDFIDEGIHYPNVKTVKVINENEQKEGYIRLSSGEIPKDIISKERLKKVYDSLTENLDYFGYESPLGMLQLRNEICKYLKTVNIDVSPSNILIVSGAIQAIQLITMGILQPGSDVLIEKPSYLYSLQVLKTLGMRKVGIPLEEDGINPLDLKKVISKKKSSILYLNPNFQNPSGQILSHEKRNQIIEICNTYQIPIVEDDVYNELWFDEKPASSLKSMDKYGNVLYLGSVSKILSPGLRIGWIVGPDTVINRLSDIKMQMDYGASSISQYVVYKWFNSGLFQEQLKELREDMKRRRDVLLRQLDKYFYDIGTWEIPKGGFYIYVKLNYEVSNFKLFYKAFERGVLYYPGYCYMPGDNRHLRLAYSFASDKDMEEGIKILKELIVEMINS